jgi:hypothetical protein
MSVGGVGDVENLTPAMRCAYFFGEEKDGAQ